MGGLFIASKLNTQKLRMIFAVLLLLAPSILAQCGVGSQCKTKVGVETCTPCPAGTACSQWLTSSGNLGAFYCQYTTCLAEGAFCNNRVGKYCSGLDCAKTSEDAVAQTCNKPTTTAAPTTTTTTTTTSPPLTTTATTTTIGIVVETTTTTTATTTTTTTTATTTSAKCMTTSGAVTGAECKFPFIFNGKVYNSCTTAGGFSQPWCSTGTNYFHISSQWGNCGSNCPGAESKVCMTESGATPNKPCVFPFRHWGKTYWTCTTDGDKKPWCSTKVDRYGNHELGNWGDCNLASCMQRTDN